MLSLGPAPEIDDLVSRWREAAADSSQSAGPAGTALRRRVWEPLVRQLGKPERVFVVPDGSLHLVSFAALPDGDGDYLVSSGPLVHYLSAERDIVSGEVGSGSGVGLLVIGGPAFEDTTVFASLSDGHEDGMANGLRTRDGATEAPPATALTLPVKSYRGKRSGCAPFA